MAGTGTPDDTPPQKLKRRMWARDNHGADVSYRDFAGNNFLVRILHAVAVTCVNAWTSRARLSQPPVRPDVFVACRRAAKPFHHSSVLRPRYTCQVEAPAYREIPRVSGH